MKYFIQQARLIPFLFFIPVLIAGGLVEGYSIISQHGSEITLTENHSAIALVNTGAISSGLSCILLAIGLFYFFGKRHLFSGILLLLFGTSMISNGLVAMGSPMHGIYGMGLSFMILPFVAMYELKGTSVDRRFFSLTILAGCILFVYFWALLVGLDPAEYRGLTQRIASVFIFGWVAFYASTIRGLLPK